MTTDSKRTTSWDGFRAAEPEFAARVERRFGLHKHHVLATLRADGAPRLTGLEVDFRGGEMWLGMMPGSRKALDLRRDPRFSMHANPGSGAEMEEGDARVSGRASEVKDPAEIARWAAGAEEGAVPEVFHLFRVEVTEVVLVSIEMPDIVFRTWKPGHALRTLRRGNEDAPPREDGVAPSGEGEPAGPAEGAA
ncbi:pyridoxamine 5'-phosphate oxidase family protein [Streptomyces iconiensis]|uniref:Pyridoxamine 5'-phosphate oxidase family protein n=1 Tax=Streptomyces iconiensis TaxID=1384038 RepID=A0ABT6ZUH0_9ACTN|nr:pyridoxamine 5'-phosphate oxidase family protein [Streptomyces iconiensis]MDJ1132704.1 pyridoxamine 5'-phosphate oxidase family protein [Streptomyces iconiensis]